MSRRIALLGLSGIGKSTLVATIKQNTKLLHLQASGLIKAEQARGAQTPESSEALRTGAVVDNQALMVAAFKREAAGTELPIIFDGHSIIDGRDALIEIPSSVFRELGLHAICFLAANPEVIAERRLADLSRERPTRNIQTLHEQQNLAEAAARRIANDIGVPFIYMMGSQIGLVSKLMSLL